VPVSTTVTDDSDEDPYADDNYAKRA